jgi:hypothetical protein
MPRIETTPDASASTPWPCGLAGAGDAVATKAAAAVRNAVVNNRRIVLVLPDAFTMAPALQRKPKKPRIASTITTSPTR